MTDTDTRLALRPKKKRRKLGERPCRKCGRVFSIYDARHRYCQWHRPRKEQLVTDNDTRLAYRPREAAEALGVNISTVYRWMEAGVVPSVKIEGVRLIRVEDVRALLARHLGG